MKEFRVILYHNQDKSFSIVLFNNEDKSEFCLKVVQPCYEGHKVYTEAYKYAYALSGFMVCDFTEVK